jgi:hypothetical protein
MPSSVGKPQPKPPTSRALTMRRRTGEDAFGKFVITGGPCNMCGHAGGFTVKYAPKSFKLPKGLSVEATILRTTDNYIGLNCGCYGKLHRQVTHITERWEGNGGKSGSAK